MKIPKERMAQLRKFCKAAATTHELFIELSEYFASLGLDRDFIHSLLSDIEHDDLTEQDVIQAFKEECKYLD